MNKEKSITVIAKVTSACNLNCPYCYTKKTIKNGKFMPIETMKKIIQNVATQYDEANIVFHGGEPMLVSNDYYKEVVEYSKFFEKNYNVKYSFAMQSNLTLLNEEKAKVYSELDIKVGFSFDGTLNGTTRGNDELILNNHKNHQNYSAVKNSGCICLITKDNIKNIEKEIDYFDKLGLDHKFNIVFNTTTEVENDLANIDYKDMIECYKKAFYHIEKSVKSNSETMFDLFFSKYNNRKSGLCANIDCRKKWIGVHPNGGLYPCGQEWDRGENSYRLGNINNCSFLDAFSSDTFIDFSNKVENKMVICKSTCEMYDVCNGGCPGEAQANAGDVNKFDSNNCFFLRGFNSFIKEQIDNLDINKISNIYIKNQIETIRREK